VLRHMTSMFHGYVVDRTTDVMHLDVEHPSEQTPESSQGCIGPAGNSLVVQIQHDINQQTAFLHEESYYFGIIC